MLEFILKSKEKRNQGKVERGKNGGVGVNKFSSKKGIVSRRDIGKQDKEIFKV